MLMLWLPGGCDVPAFPSYGRLGLVICDTVLDEANHFLTLAACCRTLIGRAPSVSALRPNVTVRRQVS